MSFQQLASPIPLFVIGKGKGVCIGVIDYGPEHNLIWVTVIDETGEIWCAPNAHVRMQENWTGGRAKSAAERSACASTTPPPALAAVPIRLKPS